MNKLYIIDRVRTDLRNGIYDLMTHVGYHSLEKEMTESLLKRCNLYNSLRRFSSDRTVPGNLKNEIKELFAFLIYREMQLELGGFHFNRFESLSTGSKETEHLNHLIETYDFDVYLQNWQQYMVYRDEPEFRSFAKSKQYRFLESSITSAIKKNKVIPGVARAIAQDIVDALNLDEDYTYLKLTKKMRQKTFVLPHNEGSEYLSLRKISFTFNGELHRVLLKRRTRNSEDFSFLLTDFGATIKGNINRKGRVKLKTENISSLT